MALPLVTRESVLAAMKHFDDSLRQQENWRNWQESPAQRYTIVFDGRRYPPKKIVSLATAVPVSGFSGGEQTNGYLRRLGFEIQVIAALSIQHLLERALAEFPNRRTQEAFSSGASMSKLFQELELEFKRLEEVTSIPTIEVRASVGKGNWAKVPWIALLDERETTTTQRGLYIVFLFAEDGSSVYLTLNQGVTDVVQSLGETRGLAELRIRAQNRREQIRALDLINKGFSVDDRIDLRAEAGLGRRYEASTIAYKRYSRNEVPSDAHVADDLDVLLTAYEFCLSHNPIHASEQATVHLLLKWTREYGANVIPEHKAVADAKGFTWWGKFGNPIGAPRLQRLKDQLRRGATTYVFLSGDQSLWRTRLLDITTNAAEIDNEFRPTYYPTEGCSFFVKISDFEMIDREWLVTNGVSDREGRDPGSIADLLSSQANPGYLRLTTAEGIQMPPPNSNTEVELDLRKIAAAFARAAREAGIQFGASHDALVRAFVASVACKGFVILTGLSGSGKTQLALKFGQWLGERAYRVCAVRPDWTGAEALFGYEDALKPILNGRAAWTVPPALEFMLGASRDTQHPYLLLLDEMNLAHVERYFADALSGIESGEACLPNLAKGSDGFWRHREDSDERIPMPKNLWIVGTVNVDETTYMFSPKVLDRANTFEFRVKSEDMSWPATKPIKCQPGELSLVRGLAKISGDAAWHVRRTSDAVVALQPRIRQLHDLLARYGLEFGHRAFYEALRFAVMAEEAGIESAVKILDRIVMQKVLPRLHGPRRKLEAPLLALARFCAHLPHEVESDDALRKMTLEEVSDPQLPDAYDKVVRMIRSVRINQFASFAE